MELFASPMACSLASHIAVIEAGLPGKIRFVENKKTDDGGDYLRFRPMATCRPCGSPTARS